MKLANYQKVKFSEFVKSQFRNIHASPTLAMNQLSKKLSKEGKNIFKFGFGQSPFPVPKNIVEQLQKNAFQKDYLPIGGLPSLNEAICSFYKKKPDYKNYLFSTQNIIVGPGSKQLMFWLQLVFNGDIVLPVPSWVSYGPQSVLCRNKFHYVRTTFQNNWHVTDEDIRKISKKIKSKNKMIILNSPNNPAGTHPVEVQKLAQALRENNFIVLSDQIYSELTFDKSIKQIANYYPEKTIISTGLSKWCGAGGWRLGYQIYPPQLKEILDMIKIVGSQTFSAVSAPVQYAAIKAYTQDHSKYLGNSIKILKFTSEYVYNQLIKAQIKVKKPTGGFYLLPDLTQILSHKFMTSRQLCEALLKEQNIAVLPGADFGFKDNQLTLRLSIVDFDGQAFLKFVQSNPYNQINYQILLKMAPNVVKGIGKFIEWINKYRK